MLKFDFTKKSRAFSPIKTVLKADQHHKYVEGRTSEKTISRTRLDEQGLELGSVLSRERRETRRWRFGQRDTSIMLSYRGDTVNGWNGASC